MARRLPWTGKARLDDVIAGLDRNYHWLVHVDRRQQDLARQVQDMVDGMVVGVREAEMRIDAAANHRFHVLWERTASLGRTLAAVAEQAAWAGAPDVGGEGPLVSVICATYNRAHLVDQALASVRAQTYVRWECIVVDDGSDDVGDAEVRRWQADTRVKVVRQEHRGPGAARNRGLLEATGEILAYLDSDNSWHPTYLARVVDALARDPEAGWTLAAQLVIGGDAPGVRSDRHGIGHLAEGNFMDLNAVAHRRSLLAEAPGPYGFDESFERLGDWELVERLSQVAGEPVRIAAVGSTYHEDGEDRVSARVPLHPHHEVMRARGRGRPAEGLRVLVAEWHYPQVSEQYVRADVEGLRSLGAHVEAWSEEGVAVAYEPGIPVHRGRLADAVDTAQPDVVLTHWLHKGEDYADVVQAAGVPLAVRGHGFDYDEAVLERLLGRRDTMVHLFPHLEARYRRPHPRLRPLPVGFDTERFVPTTGKDRSLVVRTGVALRTKDYDLFFDVARRCPEHRFVLVLCHAYRVEHEFDEIVAIRDEMQAPVEIMGDLDPEKTAEIVSDAGIYLHTHGPQPTYGMSISIAEALGTGCYVLAPDLEGMAGYLGEVGDRYRDAAHAAALVQQTLRWDDQRWARTWRAAADRAHLRFGAVEVAATMLDQWREVLGVRSPGAAPGL